MSLDTNKKKTVLKFRNRTKMNPRWQWCHTSKLRATCDFEQSSDFHCFHFRKVIRRRKQTWWKIFLIFCKTVSVYSH